MIGNIQSNKIKDLFLVPHLFAIHSVYKLKHLKMLNSLCTHPVNLFFKLIALKSNKRVE